MTATTNEHVPHSILTAVCAVPTPLLQHADRDVRRAVIEERERVVAIARDADAMLAKLGVRPDMTHAEASQFQLMVEDLDQIRKLAAAILGPGAKSSSNSTPDLVARLVQQVRKGQRAIKHLRARVHALYKKTETCDGCSQEFPPEELAQGEDCQLCRGCLDQLELEKTFDVCGATDVDKKTLEPVACPNPMPCGEHDVAHPNDGKSRKRMESFVDRVQSGRDRGPVCRWQPFQDIEELRRRMQRTIDQLQRQNDTQANTIRSLADAVDQRGLLPKYSKIERTDGSHKPGGKHHSCDYFVLDLTHDKHAKAALAAYANDAATERPQLVADLRAKYGLSEPVADAERERRVAEWEASARSEPVKPPGWPGDSGYPIAFCLRQREIEEALALMRDRDAEVARLRGAEEWAHQMGRNAQEEAMRLRADIERLTKQLAFEKAVRARLEKLNATQMSTIKQLNRCVAQARRNASVAEQVQPEGHPLQLFTVQDDDGDLWVVAEDYQAALQAYRKRVRDENPEMEEDPVPDGISHVCRAGDLLLPTMRNTISVCGKPAGYISTGNDTLDVPCPKPAGHEGHCEAAVRFKSGRMMKLRQLNI